MKDLYILWNVLFECYEVREIGHRLTQICTDGNAGAFQHKRGGKVGLLLALARYLIRLLCLVKEK